MALLCLLTMLLVTISSRKNLLIVHVSFYMVAKKKIERINTVLNLPLGVVVNSHFNMKEKYFAILILILCSVLIVTIITESVEIDSLREELEETKVQRNLLSDAIRSYDDQDDKEDISIMETTQYFLETEGYCIHNLNNWVYCY